MDFQALSKITYGLYVVSSSFDDKINGFICNTVLQVTSTPCQVVVASNNGNYTTELIRNSKHLAICALSKNCSAEVIAAFGYHTGRDTDKFLNRNYSLTEQGNPILKDGVMAWLEGKVKTETNLGSHTLFLVELENAEILDAQSEALTYEYYRNVLKGKSPKAAPTYISPEQLSSSATPDKKEQARWVCSVCGYEYDPAVGDPDSGIKPGTAFEDIPDDWTCPICGVDKTKFNKL